MTQRTESNLADSLEELLSVLVNGRIRSNGAGVAPASGKLLTGRDAYKGMKEAEVRRIRRSLDCMSTNLCIERRTSGSQLTLRTNSRSEGGVVVSN